MAAAQTSDSVPPFKSTPAVELSKNFATDINNYNLTTNSEKSSTKFWNPISWYGILNDYREKWDLPQPGPIDKLNKEMKSMMVSNFFFDGGNASLTKMLSPNFQVMHSFQLGLPGSPSNYSFASVYATEDSLMHGSMDNEGNLQARWHNTWTKNLETRVQAQLARDSTQQSMVQWEGEHFGKDCTTNVKAINPSPVDGTGIYVFGHLQSISKKLAVGSELMIQKPMPGVQETATSLMARYQPDINSAFVLQSQGTNVVTASYWQKINAKCEAGTELQIINIPSQGRREALCTVGAKYDFTAATIRASADNMGKVSMLLEEKIAPGFSFLVSGELDHLKGENKFGVGLQLES
ncbi:translocase of outer mitochondrial membrane [Mycoemilia scoparia]|uniref:Translocase of outer mitochondrial membrane n=1 Tax=Mycoemilia scoparia TaxID=417184 RepID=A0A9W8A0B8_9FUNG|nr:translocase of outer mitochondrial membrane [Mycoemilia scoparia]